MKKHAIWLICIILALPAAAQEEAEETYALSFNNVPIMTLAQFLEKSLGKPVIPHEKVKNTKITVISTEKRPLDEALQVISQALRQNGVIIQEYPLHIELLPIDQARAVQRVVLGPEEPLAAIADKARIVDKMFRVEHYDVNKLKDVIVAMLPEYGFVVADPNTRTLIVTDTVAGLEQIEKVVDRLDVPLSDQTIKKIIKVQHGDAGRIVSLVRTMVAGSLGKEAKDLFASSGGGGNKRGGKSGEQAVLIEASKSPIVLTAEVSRNWIIAVADAQTMSLIERWVEELDQQEMVDEPFEIFAVEHAEINEVAAQVQQAIEAMPGTDIRESTRIVPFVQSRRLLVFGSQRGRALVRNLLAKLDIESSEYQQVREFVLKHADASNVAEKIEALFLNRTVRSSSPWGTRYSMDGPAAVRVTPDARRNSVTVVTDPVRMKRIEEMIADEWDTPFEMEDVQPRVYILKYADPLQVQDLLDEMFTVQRRSSGPWWNPSTEESNPVGRLAGQFAFESMPDSNMLIVTTKTPSNYAVIDQIVKQLDQPQDAGLPRIIELKHANAEDLAEQLNAVMSEPGTPAEIRRATRTLSEADRESITDTGNANNNNNRNQQNRNNDQVSPGMMRFWWQSARRRTDEQEASNLVGVPRFVPVNRRNALMILAPEAYIKPLAELITELDRPGMQVVIHAVIAEIQHDDSTTLGLRIASDPSVLADPRLQDSAIGGNASANLAELMGGTFSVGDETFGRAVFGSEINIAFLIQMLKKKMDLRILFEPRLYTADNQEAQFFDGRDVPVQTRAQSSTEGAATTREFEYVPVGTRLRIRPHITKDGSVDLNINLELSRQATGENVFGNPVFDRRETTTHVILKDGETVMLSGIIRREDFTEKRKMPLLGDLPLVGGAFRSTDQAQRNRELIAFITPRVIRGGPAGEDQVEQRDRELLNRVREVFQETQQKIDAVGEQEE